MWYLYCNICPKGMEIAFRKGLMTFPNDRIAL